MYIRENDQFILYGGVAAEPLNGIAKLETYGTTDCKWDLITGIEYKGLSEGNRFVGRYGFNSVYFNRRMFFIFGCMLFDKERGERPCLNEIVILDPTT